MCRCGFDRPAVRPRTSASRAHPERLGSWRLPGPFAPRCEQARRCHRAIPAPRLLPTPFLARTASKRVDGQEHGRVSTTSRPASAGRDQWRGEKAMWLAADQGTTTAWFTLAGALGGVIFTGIIALANAVLTHRWQRLATETDQRYKRVDAPLRAA
jgi:hypothetical protein